MDINASALEIAQAIAQNPAHVTGASFLYRPTNAPSAAVGHCPILDFPVSGPSFGVFSSGDVRDIPKPGIFASTSLNGNTPSGRGYSAYDVTTLRIDLDVPTGMGYAAVDLQFLSEEFPEYVGTQYNDAVVPELVPLGNPSTWTTNGTELSAPDNFAVDADGEIISINSTGVAQMSPLYAPGTAFDAGQSSAGGDQNGAATQLLRAYTPISKAGPQTLYISVFDQSDMVLDSAILVDNLHFGVGTKNPGVNPAIDITAQAPAEQFPEGSTVLVSGKVESTDPIAAVYVNGVPVDAVDAAGNFFTQVTIGNGGNEFIFEGISVNELTASTILDLQGYAPGKNTFDSMSDVTASL